MLVQLLDVDYFLNGNKPVLRLYCKNDSGRSVCFFYDKFNPYFYVRKNDDNIKKLEELGVKFSVEKKFLPVGYSEEPTDLIKIELNDPSTVPKVRELFKESFDSDVLFKYRFMIDMGLKGMAWYEIEGTPLRTNMIKIPTYNIKSITPADRTDNCELKTLCIDIECLQTDFTRQMDARRDPIIMVSLSFFPEHKNMKSLVLVSKPYSGNNARGYPDEKEMLKEFMSLIDEYDPDVITGYNIINFDLPHILERLKKFDIPSTMGRSDKLVFAKQMSGKMGILGVPITGRIVFDAYQVIKNDVYIRLHRYNLDTVAKELIGEEKKDVSYDQIPELWKKDLAKLVDYAENDAVITMNLVMKRRLMDKFVEVSKISGVLLQDSFGGQTVRIETLIMHEFKKRNMVMPLKPSKSMLSKRAEEKIKGATVLEPKKGLHTNCVIVLDFQSLYPSIIKAYNVSPDSIISKDSELECYTSPTGPKFISKKLYKGVFPTIIERLVSTRQVVKKKMKQAEGTERVILDAKQHAIKILANSFYGYCGYIRARLYTYDVASSITAFGRYNIIKTKEYVEKNYPVEVVYGDTDSLFLGSNLTSVDEAEKLGNEISKNASQGDLIFEFEKVYKSFLILAKKRYTGWKFTKGKDGWEDKIEMKGIETVRRDWCPLVIDTMNAVINIVLKEGDVKKAADLVKGVIKDLVDGNVPLEKLTIIKGITKSLDGYDGTLPHIELARKMKNRNPREPPKVGDRIGYVIIKGKELVSKRAEHPDYVNQYNLPIDPEYYIYNQLLPPTERILSSMGVERIELFGGGKQVNLIDMFSKKKATTDVVICSSCGKIHRRTPLSMTCGCGTRLVVSV